jgi:hypothetical protein
MADIRTSEVDAKLAPVNVDPWDLYGITSTNKQRLLRPLLRKPKIRTWRAEKDKIHILFYGHNFWTIALREIRFSAIKHHGHTCKVTESLFCLTKLSNWWWCEILRLCWDKLWTTLYIAMYFYVMLHLCIVFCLLNNIRKADGSVLSKTFVLSFVM